MKIQRVTNLSYCGSDRNISANANYPKNETFQSDFEKLKQNKTLTYIAGGLGIIFFAALAKFSISKISKAIKSSKVQLPQENVVTVQKPRFLYHMTSKENYDSICADGCIKKSRIDDGVFLSDENTIKNKYDDNTLKRMVQWYGGYMQNIGGPQSQSHKIVILKVPVNPEEENLYKWRAIRLVGADNEGLSNEWINFADIGKEELNQLWQRPLEFLCKNEIPAEKFEKIAEIDLTTLPQREFVTRFKELANI